MRQLLDRDRLNALPPKQVTMAGMTALDRLQDYQPEAQVTGLASLFLLLCETYGVEPQDVFTVTKNLMVEADGARPEFRAFRNYLEYEVKK